MCVCCRKSTMSGPELVAGVRRGVEWREGGRGNAELVAGVGRGV